MRALTRVEARRFRGQLAAALAMVDGGTKDGPWRCACHCGSRIEHALRVAEQADGALRSAVGGRGSVGGHSDPVFSSALPALMGLGADPQHVELDPSPLWLEQLTEKTNAASKAVADLVAIVYVVGSIDSTDPKTLGASGTGTGNCEACEHLCTGTAEDRLRSGFCPACRMAYKRAGSPDRFQWCRQRRADLAAAVQAVEDGNREHAG